MAFFLLIVTVITIAFHGLGCYGGGCKHFSSGFLTVAAVWLAHFLVTLSSIRQLNTIEGSVTRALNVVALLPSILFIVGTILLLLFAMIGNLTGAW